MSFDVALHQLAPAVMQVIVSSEIAGQEKRDVAEIGPRLIVLNGGKVDLLYILQRRRQWPAVAPVDFVSPSIELVFGFCGRVFQFAKDIGNLLGPVQLTQVRGV